VAAGGEKKDAQDLLRWLRLNAVSGKRSTTTSNWQRVAAAVKITKMHFKIPESKRGGGQSEEKPGKTRKTHGVCRRKRPAFHWTGQSLSLSLSLSYCSSLGSPSRLPRMPVCLSNDFAKYAQKCQHQHPAIWCPKWSVTGSANSAQLGRPVDQDKMPLQFGLKAL